MNFIWNSMCKGNSCFNIFQNLTGGSIFCPKTQTPSLWGGESAGVVCKISQSFWSYSPFTLAHAYHFVWERMENATDRAFQGQFFRRFFPQWLLFFFSNIILFVSVNPSRWETLKLAIGFVGKTKKHIHCSLTKWSKFSTTFHLSMSSCCSLRCHHSPPSSCEKRLPEIIFRNMQPSEILLFHTKRFHNF